MKHLSATLFCLLLALLFSRPVAAQAATDTLPGQAKFTRLLAVSLCTHIQEASLTKPFEQLDAKQANELFMKLMMTSMSEHATEFSALLTEGQQRKMNVQKLGKAIGLGAVTKLGTDCPNSMALIMRTSTAQDAMGTKGQKSFNNIAPEEKAVLQPMADSICIKLSAEDSRQPLRQRSPKERTQVMTMLMQTVMLKNMPNLLTVYTTQQLTEKESLSAFGIKLASLMMTQCPKYLVLMGEDAKGKR